MREVAWMMWEINTRLRDINVQAEQAKPKIREQQLGLDETMKSDKCMYEIFGRLGNIQHSLLVVRCLFNPETRIRGVYFYDNDMIACHRMHAE